MLKKLVPLIAGLSLCLLCFSAQAQTDAATSAVSGAVEKLRVQMVTPDEAALKALLADDLSYGHSGGKIDTKASFVADLLSGASDFVSIDLSEQTVRVVGNTAIVRHTLSAATNDGGKPGTVKLHILTVWQKQGSDWKLLARQAVRI
ncbi:MAG TPA: nuclear transport factor 2 family protein [Rhodocyclaceae bacterium]|nr:nuclear transport factor 2 family protein [Rhodocyclaceae bacterium]